MSCLNQCRGQVQVNMTGTFCTVSAAPANSTVLPQTRKLQLPHANCYTTHCKHHTLHSTLHYTLQHYTATCYKHHTLQRHTHICHTQIQATNTHIHVSAELAASQAEPSAPAVEPTPSAVSQSNWIPSQQTVLECNREGIRNFAKFCKQ